jgi:hypothetical protein
MATCNEVKTVQVLETFDVACWQILLQKLVGGDGPSRRKFANEARKIESSIDLPHQMIFGNRLAKMKLVEQLTLVTLQTAHHGSTPPRPSTNRTREARLDQIGLPQVVRFPPGCNHGADTSKMQDPDIPTLTIGYRHCRVLRSLARPERWPIQARVSARLGSPLPSSND